LVRSAPIDSLMRPRKSNFACMCFPRFQHGITHIGVAPAVPTPPAPTQQVTFMTAFAIAMGVAAEVVKVPAIVGIFTAGMCFGGSGALPCPATFFMVEV
jgi:hypothetical protein